ncbi:PREDICTED: glycine-rich protein 5-like isoform X3 [Lupinus angustifolius]|uniref:glycine-rich protein 5-like isoform X3 n=1 Tax=Lupinus angustifolius TaxID=3871 RepID=UPI00092E94C1|nr:PREDICTED: glycine-rich protein 5-like isoform X3 [Lupinus angustifolius]
MERKNILVVVLGICLMLGMSEYVDGRKNLNKAKEDVKNPEWFFDNVPGVVIGGAGGHGGYGAGEGGGGGLGGGVGGIGKGIVGGIGGYGGVYKGIGGIEGGVGAIGGVGGFIGGGHKYVDANKP